MFNLVYRDGAPENAGHYEIFDTDGTTEFKVGTLVSVSAGQAVPYESGKPYGVVAIGSKDEGSGRIGDQISVLKITEDMIFRCPQKGEVNWGDESQLVGWKGEFDKDFVTISVSTPTGYAFEITSVVDIKKNSTGYVTSGGVIEGRFVYAPET